NGVPVVVSASSTAVALGAACGAQRSDCPSSVSLLTKVCNAGAQRAAIPQPRGRACSKRHGNLEMPALRAEGEIRDECFWPERGKNRAIGHTAATGSYRKADSKLRVRAVPKAEGADHGDGVDGIKSW